MPSLELKNDPYNVIITGVGGQGNVLASRVLGNMMAAKGLHVTIGETFGASQRGGSVMSHLRISCDSEWSPQIPLGAAHVVVALEPIEALRVLSSYGNPDVLVVCNRRPIYPVGVIAGDSQYPEVDDLQSWVEDLSDKAYFLDATDDAVRSLGQPILGNIIMIGALAGTGVLPLDRSTFQKVMERTMPADKVELNLKAYDMGAAITY